MSPQTISLFINKFIIYFSFLYSHLKDAHVLLTEINKNSKNAVGVAAYKNTGFYPSQKTVALRFTAKNGHAEYKDSI